MPDAARQHSEQDSTVIETLQSLIVAFVLAMTFRGFVTEGFVIPTGSMAPTLLGQHVRMHSPETGADFAMDGKTIADDFAEAQARRNVNHTYNLVDPMIGPVMPANPIGVRDLGPSVRMGDRILVLKSLYPFAAPDRFDVVVFKNPTDPSGDDENFIKRLIGLPNEKIWLADGDVFAGHAAHPEKLDDYRIQRKPEFIQRAVWRPVHHSDYLPESTEALGPGMERSPWMFMDEHWSLDGHTYRCSTDGESGMTWNVHQRPLDDWTAYNMSLDTRDQRLRPGEPPARGRFDRYYISDLRVAAAVVAERAAFGTTFELKARHHVFQFIIENGRAIVRMRDDDAPDQWKGPGPAAIDLPGPGTVFNLEFWHVDQAMSIYLDGERVTHFEYDWLPVDRLQFATNQFFPDSVEDLARYRPNPAFLEWRFRGTPVTLTRVRVDRDLYYQPVQGAGTYGTNSDRPAVLGPDQFFMLGDNSPASRDSRLWGAPAAIVAHQIDDSPFVVHRRLLLGKAWVVYFPAPHAIADGGVGVIPDFGRLRYIR
jgi:signal peptidase I